MQKLGRNVGGYKGETIDIAAVLRDVQQAALKAGWTFEAVPTAEGMELRTWQRQPAQPRQRVYLSAGIHGDEPAGPLAVRQLVQENLWPPDLALWLCPCLNPTGFSQGRREQAQGIDLNSQYLHPEAVVTRAHIAWLGRQPAFELTLCLHEVWEAHGVYLYQLIADDMLSYGVKIYR